MSTTVVIRKLTKGTEATRILDQLESVIGLSGERVEDGRRYDLSDDDLIIAMASINGQLDEISDTWATHLEIEVFPE